MNNHEGNDKKEKKGLRVGSLIVTLLTLVIIIVLVIVSVTTIPTGHTGVVTTFGRVENYTLDAGVHVKAPWQKVIKMDNRVQKATTDLFCFSSDIQEVSMTYTLNYQIDKNNAMEIYRTVGQQYYDKIITPCVTEAVKVVTARYTAEELVSNRAELAINVEEELAKRLEQYNIQVVSTSIENFDFTDAFTDAVEAKQVAEQNKLRAETEAEQARIEAQAKADVRLIETQAAAEAKLIETEAEAKAKLIQAEAEAEANRTVAESLTQEILNKMYYDKWDGDLPNVYGDAGGTLVEIPIE